MSDLWYPEKPPEKAPEAELDFTNLPIEVAIKNIDDVSPEEFTLSRREGFGGSDAGVLLGVNPYTNIQELVKQKASRTLSEEELAVRNNIAVMKGNDLEPLIIQKATKMLGFNIIKPKDSYVFKEFPYLRMNFDGVAGTAGNYFPIEIKVVTKSGERHYKRAKACYVERVGFRQPQVLEWDENSINTIETKAAMVGIPPYYYAQVQQEMMALNAPYGYLAALEETSWTVFIYFIPRDAAVQRAIKLQGWKYWNQVEELRNQNGYYDALTEEVEPDEHHQTGRDGDPI